MGLSRYELWFATTAIAVVVAGTSVSAQGISPTVIAAGATVPTQGMANQPARINADVSTPAAAPSAEVVQEPAAAIAAPAPAASPAPIDTAADAVKDLAPSAIAAPAEPMPAAAPVVTMDQQVADKIRDLFSGKADQLIDRKIKPAVESFYAARGYAPLWSENGAQSKRGKAAASFLAGVDADGLDPADYPVPSFTSTDVGALAEAELKFTASLLRYVRHAQLGRVHYSRVSADIVYDQVPPEPGAVLGQLAGTDDMANSLDSYNPQHPGYKALKAKLADARGLTGRSRIPAGQPVKVGMNDPRVPAVRERLGIAGAAGDTTFDKALSEAVKKFQRQRDMAQTGVLNNATIDAMNGVRRDHEANIIIANMERWRWLPRDLGQAYVMVNIPDYTLKVVDHGSTVWTTRIVVGKPGEKATPLLSETMKYITVNPTWNVPPSIVHNEYLPALQQDPTVLERMGLRVEYNRDGSVHISQPPGANNALGRIRFNFPNKFLVYQHDTPDKNLFALTTRAYSHGCMRVQFPDKYAEVLLGISNPRDGYTAERIRRMYGNGERDIQLTTPIPVHLTYQTAYVDDAGHLAMRDDIYGRDARLLAVLKNEDRRMADTPAEHREASSGPRRTAMRMVAPPPPPARTSFFGFLFR